MSIFSEIQRIAQEGISTLEEKNRRRAHLNRIRAALKREEAASRQEYIALGRYYYTNLRDKDNPVTEPHCQRLEEIETRLNAAIDQLEKCYELVAKEKSKKKENVLLDDVQCVDVDSVYSQARDIMHDMKEGAASIAEQVGEGAKDAAYKVKDAAEKIGNEVKKSVQTAAQAVGSDKLADAMSENRQEDNDIQRAAEIDENENLPFS